MESLRILEVCVVALCVLAAVFAPRRCAPWVRWILRGLRRIGGRRALAVGLVGVTAFAVSAGLSALRWPEPRVHDEFSYLLAADTFARGRLTNPPTPFQEHFRTYHVLQRPTYQSKYPPGQGLFLALGQVVFGRPLLGVWLSFALACSAVCWMLQAWVPGRWAVAGALLALIHLGVMDDWVRGRFFYWSQSYWGGAVPTLGGALVFGALRRLVREPRPRHAMVLAAGLVVLAATRPYEGLVASLGAAAVVLGWFRWRSRPTARTWLSRVAGPAALVLSLGAAALGFYNYRVTGNPLLMPYRAHEASAKAGSPFLSLQTLGGLWETGDATEGEDEEVQHARRTRWLAREYRRRFVWLWSFFCGPALTIPLLVLPWAVRDRWTVLAVATCIGVTGANLLTAAGFPHYYSPVAPLVLLILVQGLRRLYLWKPGGLPRGRALVTGLLGSCLLTFGVAVGLHGRWALAGHGPELWSRYRASILCELERKPGKHLVLVRYSPQHYWKNEWVYNGADLENAKVIWARNRDSVDTSLLLRHYRDRTVWDVSADASPPKLKRSQLRYAPLPSAADPRAGG